MRLAGWNFVQDHFGLQLLHPAFEVVTASGFLGRKVKVACTRFKQRQALRSEETCRKEPGWGSLSECLLLALGKREVAC